MKKNLLLKCGWLTIVCLLCSVNIFAQKPVRNLVKTNGYTSNGTATIPADAAPVVKAEAWGAGGAGGHAQLSSGIWVAVAGGGGGAYAGDLVPLTNERVFTLTVGKGGTNSNGSAVHGGNSLVEYNGTTVVEAGGGKSVTGTNNKTGAEGGKAIKGGNNRKWNGGNGGSRGNNDATGGGGGAAASPTAKGANANGGIGGRSTDQIAGSGADGQLGTSSASAGDQYGGGGAGAVASMLSRTRGGGAGADGYVRLTYMIFNIKDTTLKTGICSGDNLSFVPAGDYPRGATFTWTATNDNVTITGDGTTQASRITATLVNNTQTTQNVVFNCTATYTDNTYGLGVLTETFTLTVPVYAQMTPGAIMAEQFVCAGQTVNQLQTVEGQVAYGGKESHYQWQIFSNNHWSNITNGNDLITTEYYTPFQSGVNYFRRQYVDETCGTVNSNELKVTNVNPMNLSDMTGFEILCAGSGIPYEKQFTASVSSGMGSGTEYTIYWQKRVNNGEWSNVRVANTQEEDSYTVSFTPALEQNGDTLEYRYAVKFSTCDSVFCNGTYKIVVRKIEDYTSQFKDVTITIWYGLIDTNLTHMKAPVLDPPAFSVTGPTVVGTTPEDLEHVTSGDYVFSWKVVDSCGFENDYTQNVKVEISPCEEQIDGYKVVRIGRDCWMAENLREEVEGASYYQDDNNNRAFGLLYDWNTAMTTNTSNNNRNLIRAAATPQNGEYVRGVCPEGWALPTLAQFNTMVAAAGGVDAVKSTEGWAAGYEGNNNSGFNAMAPGYYNSTAAQYQRQLAYAGFWVVDDNQYSAQGQVPSVRIDYFCDDANCVGQFKTDKLSVRCVKISQ